PKANAKGNSGLAGRFVIPIGNATTASARTLVVATQINLNASWFSFSFNLSARDLTNFRRSLITLGAKVAEPITTAFLAEGPATLAAFVNYVTFSLVSARGTLWVGSHTLTSLKPRQVFRRGF